MNGFNVLSPKLTLLMNESRDANLIGGGLFKFGWWLICSIPLLYSCRWYCVLKSLFMLIMNMINRRIARQRLRMHGKAMVLAVGGVNQVPARTGMPGECRRPGWKRKLYTRRQYGSMVVGGTSNMTMIFHGGKGGWMRENCRSRHEAEKEE